mmetsp:Transcript_21216/g.68462  ORF Transcript_21216/g.68462 Transcript_21216/m.68462 type:complete len:228 (-) Transcript_21216:70-753(-)
MALATPMMASAMRYWMHSLNTACGWLLDRCMNRDSSSPMARASLECTTGGSCLWSPTSTNEDAKRSGPMHAGCVIWPASSTTHTSNLRRVNRACLMPRHVHATSLERRNRRLSCRTVRTRIPPPPPRSGTRGDCDTGLACVSTSAAAAASSSSIHPSNDTVCGRTRGCTLRGLPSRRKSVTPLSCSLSSTLSMAVCVCEVTSTDIPRASSERIANAITVVFPVPGMP